tara:strand:+ start:132 stop:860 length:729 start_codon:yes stop_codon:yes gene_type:complete
MKLKKLLGTQAYWTINKDLANEFGLHATLLLQHLIDLRESFFTSGTPFYQQHSRMKVDLGMSEYQLRQATKKLVEAGFINVQRKGIPPKYEYSINDSNLYRFFNLTHIDQNTEPLKVKLFDEKHQELTLTQTIDNNTKLVDTTDDIKGKIFFKIVDLYPKNRIGNRQHGLKKFKKLDINQAKLAATNLKRYLKVAGQYVKSLQNYILEECYTEAWLSAEETNNNKSDITNTKTFTQNYDDIT